MLSINLVVNGGESTAGTCTLFPSTSIVLLPSGGISNILPGIFSIPGNFLVIKGFGCRS